LKPVASPETKMLQLVVSKVISEGILIDPYSDGWYQSCQLDKLKITAINVFPSSTLPEKLAQMVASKSTLDAAMQFKIRCWATK
jgi:hypothetical protein